jgi:hypothetical protein
VGCLNFFIAIYFQGHKLLRNDATEGYVGGLVLSLLLVRCSSDCKCTSPWFTCLGLAPVGYCFESPVHVTRTSGDERSY